MAKTTGPTSFGFMRHDGKLVAHPDEAPIRRRMFELFAEHQRKKTVAEILNAEGARSRNGALFTGQTVGRLLEDERVIGIKGKVQAIIEKDLFERCQTILTSQKASGGAKRKSVHLFAGLIYCACGEKMYVPSNSKKYVCSLCRAKMPAVDLEAVFARHLSKCKVPDELAWDFADMELLWPRLDFEDKRELVECILNSIEIDDKRITCSFVSHL